LASADELYVRDASGDVSQRTTYGTLTAVADAHIADTSDAHDASAVSILDAAGNYTATDVEGALAELPSQYAPLSAIATACVAAAASDQTVANNTWTTVALGAETFDDDGWHDNSTNNERITVDAAGLYLVSARLRWNANATGYRAVRVLKNGSTATDRIFCLAQTPGMSATATVMESTSVLRLAANDYVVMQGIQTSGGDLALQLGTVPQNVSLSVVRLGN